MTKLPQKSFFFALVLHIIVFFRVTSERAYGRCWFELEEYFSCEFLGNSWLRTIKTVWLLSICTVLFSESFWWLLCTQNALGQFQNCPDLDAILAKPVSLVCLPACIIFLPCHQWRHLSFYNQIPIYYLLHTSHCSWRGEPHGDDTHISLCEICENNKVFLY